MLLLLSAPARDDTLDINRNFFAGAILLLPLGIMADALSPLL